MRVLARFRPTKSNQSKNKLNTREEKLKCLYSITFLFHLNVIVMFINLLKKELNFPIDIIYCNIIINIYKMLNFTERK